MFDIFDASELEQLRADSFRAYRRAVSREDILNNGCVIYGAGMHGRMVFYGLKEAGITPLCFIDRNPALHGTAIGGVRVEPAAELSNYKNSIIIIASCLVRSIIRDNPFFENGKAVLWSAISDFCQVLPEIPDSIDVFFEDESVSQAYALMADETSRTIFKNFIKFYICFDESLFSGHDPDGYFASDLPLNHHRFIDAGAYNGDTLQSWLSHGFPKSPEDRYYAFEPCQDAFSELRAFTATLPEKTRNHVQLFNVGLGAEDATLYLIKADVGSRLADYAADDEAGGRNGYNVRVSRLDDVLAEASPTFIKADVEGAELSLLEGARETIRRLTPDLAFSVYHRYSDLWRIPLWINRQNSEYRIFLRRHSRYNDDVVCYALRRE